MQLANFEEIRRRFKWRIPRKFNIAKEVCDNHSKGDRTALVHVDPDWRVRRYSFRQIGAYSRRLSNFLLESGVSSGDRIAIVLPQSPEAAIAHIAIYRLGGIAVPISPLFRSQGLAYRIKDSGAKMVITNSEIMRIMPGFPFAKLLVDGDFWREVKGASSHFSLHETSPHEPALIIYTSGTTGEPAGVLLPHRTLLGRLTGLQLAHYPFPSEEDVFWTPADWSWVAGLLDSLLGPWFFGVTVVSHDRRKFSPSEAFQLIEELGVRNACIPPTGLRLMVKHLRGKRFDFSSLRSIHSGGEVLGERTFLLARDLLGISVNEIYGLTEASFLIGNSGKLFPVKPGSMGKPYPGHFIEVLDKNGKPASQNRMGELAVRRDDPVLFLRYWNDPDGSSKRFIADWFLTGDLVVKDSDGYFWFKGRMDDIIKTAGYSVSPIEVEACLMKHPAVEEVAVTSVPDVVRGSVIKAFVKPSKGYTASSRLAQQIKAFVRKTLSLHEYPRVIEFVNKLPKTPTGKMARRLLRSPN